MRGWIWVGLAGCSACDEPTDPPPVGSGVEVEASGVLTCADPSLRTAAPYRTDKESPATGLDEANLAGGGMIVDDFDGDGLYDLFIPSEEWLQLFWGASSEPTFVTPPVSEIAGVDLSMAVGGSAADVDADGDLDLVVTRWEQPVVLLRNQGGRVFVDGTADAGLTTAPRKYQSASWGDIDGDGDLDLFLGTYGEKAKIEDDLCGDHVPDGSELWVNDGDGTFTNATDRLPDEVHDGYVFASGFYDLDDDQLPELVVSNDDGGCQPSLLLRNTGGGFEVDGSAGISRGESHDMGMGVADLNGDELPDFALTSWQSVTVLRSVASAGVWSDAAQALGVEVDHIGAAHQDYGWGAEFADVDNDADVDLAMTFGFWSYYTGTMDARFQRDGLWLQQGGQFSDQAPLWGVGDQGVGRGLVFVDLNHDGWLDLVKRQLDLPTPMYVSHCGDEGWLRISLRDEGNNPRAIGAKVRVKAGGLTQVRWMQSGSSGMYTGGPSEVHFGLGAVDVVDAIEVVWPDGEVTVTEAVDSRQVLTLTRVPAP